jgi:hypothetical protein
MSNQVALQNLRETHELAASILAGENIDVQFVDGLHAPATFDTVNRILRINRLDDSQVHLTPGLVGHEVGHALFTNMTADDIKNLRAVTFILNAVEDGYQERQYCLKYPGGKKFLFEVFHYFFEGEGHKAAQAKAAKAGGKPLPHIIQILNTLNYNCKGMKHGFYRQYPDFVLDEDVDLLREAELLNEPIFKQRWYFVRVLSAALKKYLENKDDYEDEDEDEDEGGGQGGGQGQSGSAQQPLLEDQEGKQDEAGDEGEQSESKDASDKSDDKDQKSRDQKSKDKSGKKDKSEKSEKSDLNGADEGDEEESDDAESGTEGDDDSDADGDSGEGQECEQAGAEDDCREGGEGSEGDEGGEGDDEGQDESESGDKQSQGSTSGKGTKPKAPKPAPTEKDLDDAMKAIEDAVDQNRKDINDHHSKLKFASGKGAPRLISHAALMATAAVHDILSDGGGTVRKTAAEAERLLAVVQESVIKGRAANGGWEDTLMKARGTARAIFSAFSARRSAHNLANTQYRRSGRLDATRLAYYEISDDIFENSMISPQQVNHAYVAVLDWSGSMAQSALALTRRVMELTLFAEMADVELEVWLYTTGDHGVGNGRVDPVAWNSTWVDSRMIRVLNTKKDAGLTTQRLKMLWLTATQGSAAGYMGGYLGGNRSILNHLSMSGTNILEGTILGHGQLAAMRAQRKTLFVLTDGDDASSFNRSVDPTGRVGRGDNYDCTFNGVSIQSLTGQSKETIRDRATRVLTEFYQSQYEHKTVCIEWDCQSGRNRQKFGASNVISVKSGNDSRYAEVDNVFVRELVEALL